MLVIEMIILLLLFINRAFLKFDLETSYENQRFNKKTFFTANSYFG